MTPTHNHINCRSLADKLDSVVLRQNYSSRVSVATSLRVEELHYSKTTSYLHSVILPFVSRTQLDGRGTSSESTFDAKVAKQLDVQTLPKFYLAKRWQIQSHLKAIRS